VKNLFPTPTTPYIVCTPPYNDISSGVKTLHLLAHALNSIGYRAFISLTEPPNEKYPTGANPDLLTPHLIGDAPKHAIAVYPDIITDNPLRLKRVVRYLLARPGQFRTYRPLVTDLIWNHSSGIAKEMGHDRFLNIPCTDRRIFYPPRNNAEPRKGACYYAHKYDRIHGNKLLPITDGAIRLEGPPERLAGILRRSEKVYLYEMSNIIMDATLCGCPVILIKSDYFKDITMMSDFQGFGVRWNDAPDTPINPNETDDWVNQMKDDYRMRLFQFWEQLEEFATSTQKHFNDTAPLSI